MRRSQNLMRFLGSHHLAPLQLLGEAGYAALGQGDPDTAASFFRALRILAPDEPVGRLGIAQAAIIRHSPEQAIEEAQRALSMQRSDATTQGMAWNLIGEARLAMRLPAEARAAFRNASKADPEGPGATEAQLWIGRIDAFMTSCGSPLDASTGLRLLPKANATEVAP